MYNTECMAEKMNDTTKINEQDLAECVISRRPVGTKMIELFKITWIEGFRESGDGRGAYVGALPVFGFRGALEDPHCNDDHHLQEDL